MPNTVYPGAIDSFADPTPTTARVGHAAQHGVVNDAVFALETKLGVTGSAVNTSFDFKLSGVATGDKAASKTGTETLTNKTLTSPTITGGTLTTSTLNTFNTSTTSAANAIPVMNGSGTMPSATVDGASLTTGAIKLFHVSTSGTFNLAAGLALITGLSFTPTIPAGGRSVLLMARLNMQQNTDGNSNLSAQFFGGGAGIGSSQSYPIVRSGFGLTFVMMMEDTNPGSGSRAYQVQGQYSGGAGTPFIQSGSEFMGYLI